MKWDVFFRLDADPKIGIGHLRRCQALIEGFQQAGLKRFAFLTRTPKNIHEWLGRRHAVFPLRAKTFQEEIPQIKKIFSSGGARFTLIDRYGISSAYLAALKRFIPVLLSLNDDAVLKDYPVDGIINYNIYAKSLKYPRSTGARLFLGTEFVPVRKEFLDLRRTQIRSADGTRKVFVALGGYAKPADLEKIRRALESMRQPLEVSWASGRTRDMARKMAGADLAVSAGGVTTYELACLGIPAVLVILAENQRLSAAGWQDCGSAVNLGSFRALSQKTLSAKVKQLLFHEERRRQMSRCAFRQVDGQGGVRLARALIRTFGGKSL